MWGTRQRLYSLLTANTKIVCNWQSALATKQVEYMQPSDEHADKHQYSLEQSTHA